MRCCRGACQPGHPRRLKRRRAGPGGRPALLGGACRPSTVRRPSTPPHTLQQQQQLLTLTDWYWFILNQARVEALSQYTRHGRFISIKTKAATVRRLARFFSLLVWSAADNLNALWICLASDTKQPNSKEINRPCDHIKGPQMDQPSRKQQGSA